MGSAAWCVCSIRDGPGTRRPKKLVDGALRSLGDGPPAHQIIQLYILNYNKPDGFQGPKKENAIPFRLPNWLYPTQLIEIVNKSPDRLPVFEQMAPGSRIESGMTVKNKIQTGSTGFT
jgi:hypothetical protein